MSSFSPPLVGIDVGGTFTDFVLWEPQSKTLRTHKELSTPHDQSEAMLAGLRALGVAEAEIVHGSTVATNALLEGKGARTGLLTTAGFRDVLALGRQNRPHLYRLVQPPQPPLVPRHWRWEVAERLNEKGKVLQPLDEGRIKVLAEEIAASGVDSLAIVFLFSFLNPTHEQRAAQILRARLPQLLLTLSCELLPEHREFERTATTVINAYVRPPVAHYLTRLVEQLGPGRRLRVMQSNGGLISAAQAGQEAARLALSGPAGGVVGAFRLMQQVDGTDTPALLTFDMGGTSTDVALCPGAILTTTEAEIGGLPLRLPVIDLHTVGAGGGSMARVDSGGALRVGPESAGASPGPACYGRGGRAPTVTDANLVLGRLDPARFLGGQMRLDVEAARRAVSTIAEPLGLSIERAALGILAVANAVMERALRRVSVERGHDPRTFTLFPFGGAGPLHACALADALAMTHIVIPRQASVLSALGMLLAPQARDLSHAMLHPLETLVVDDLRRVLDSLQSQAQAALAAEGIKAPTWHVAMDCRYVGQSYELTIPLALPLEPPSLSLLAAEFHAAHAQRYGARYPRPIEAVTLRLRGSAPAPLAQGWLTATPALAHGANPAGTSLVWFDGDAPVLTPGYERASLAPGTTFNGPALLYQPDTTVVVGPRWAGRIDDWGNVTLQSSSTSY
ncbi:MAG: hydantoinase/oxoprolinase family protein [Ardenticatenales bacterium]|nr:hydantoinase/oxoprolinase family protein [Ardenticatenales bacterium]